MRGWEIRVDFCSVCCQRDVLGYPLQDEETLSTIYWCSACIDEHGDRVTPFPPLASDEDEDNNQASTTDVSNVAFPELPATTKRQAEVADHALDEHPAFAQTESGSKRQRTGENGGNMDCMKNMDNSPIHGAATAGGS